MGGWMNGAEGGCEWMERYRDDGWRDKMIGGSLDGQTDRKQKGPKEI